MLFELERILSAPGCHLMVMVDPHGVGVTMAFIEHLHLHRVDALNVVGVEESDPSLAHANRTQGQAGDLRGGGVLIQSPSETKSNEWCLRLRFCIVRLGWAVENMG